MKYCTYCSQDKELNEFKIIRGRMQNKCNPCFKRIKAEQDERYRIANKERLAEKKSDYYFNNRVSIQAKNRAKYQADKNYYLERSLLWKRKNVGRHNANCMKRHVRKIQQSPDWSVLDEKNKFFIEEIYDLAKLRANMTGVKHHVDHIVPLRGKLVSGLHVWYNLQVLTASENCSKGNHYE